MDPEKMVESANMDEDVKDKRARKHGKQVSKSFNRFVHEQPEFDEAVLVYLDEETESIGIANHVSTQPGGVIAHAIRAAMDWLMDRSPNVEGNV